MSSDTHHIFRAAEPQPLPPGYVWWKDNGCRATCSCGWRADTNSVDTATAARHWDTHHRQTLPTPEDAA